MCCQTHLRSMYRTKDLIVEDQTPAPSSNIPEHRVHSGGRSNCHGHMSGAPGNWSIRAHHRVGDRVDADVVVDDEAKD